VTLVEKCGFSVSSTELVDRYNEYFYGDTLMRYTVTVVTVVSWFVYFYSFRAKCHHVVTLRTFSAIQA